MDTAHHWQVTNLESGSKLLPYLKSKLGEEASLRSIKRQIDSRRCFVNGRSAYIANYQLYAGDHVELLPGSGSAKKIRFEKDRILFENPNLLIYNKPPGIACDEKGIIFPARNHDKDLRLIHRLDKDTSGALLFAKSADAFERFVEMFRKKEVKKTYLAVVEGHIQSKEGFIKNYLGKKAHLEGQVLWGEVPPGKGSLAETEWQVHSTSRTATCLYCFPLTGRTHQLRVHLAGMGHPILGDYQYGRPSDAYMPDRMLLHAYQILFNDPYSGREIRVTAPVPEDFATAFEKIFKRKWHG